jgi:hypothetical protein
MSALTSSWRKTPQPLGEQLLKDSLDRGGGLIVAVPVNTLRPLGTQRGWITGCGCLQAF